MLEPEEWRAIPGLPLYECSSLGRVKALAKTTKSRWGIYNFIISEKLLSGHRTKLGYIKHSVSGRKMFAHRLVAMAFIPNPENKPEVNHINGVASDNRVTNLEWVTPKENMHHCFNVIKTGARGITSARSKLSETDVLDIRSLKTFGAKQVSLAKAYHVTGECISSIVNRYTWKHI